MVGELANDITSLDVHGEQNDVVGLLLRNTRNYIEHRCKKRSIKNKKTLKNVKNVDKIKNV